MHFLRLAHRHTNQLFDSSFVICHHHWWLSWFTKDKTTTIKKRSIRNSGRGSEIAETANKKRRSSLVTRWRLLYTVRAKTKKKKKKNEEFLWVYTALRHISHRKIKGNTIIIILLFRMYTIVHIHGINNNFYGFRTTLMFDKYRNLIYAAMVHIFLMNIFHGPRERER